MSLSQILRFFLLGLIPLLVIVGIPCALYLILGKEVFGWVVFSLAMIFVTFAFGILVDIILDERRESRDRNSRNSYL